MWSSLWQDMLLRASLPCLLKLLFLPMQDLKVEKDEVEKNIDKIAEEIAGRPQQHTIVVLGKLRGLSSIFSIFWEGGRQTTLAHCLHTQVPPARDWGKENLEHTSDVMSTPQSAAMPYMWHGSCPQRI